MKPVHLSAEGLCLARGQRVLFRDLRIELRSGEMVVMTGPNGAGKSSLLRALIGLAPLRSGSLRLSIDGGVSAPIAPANLRSLCLVQGHAAGVKSELTAIENLRLCAALDLPPVSGTPDEMQRAFPAPDLLASDAAAAFDLALERVGLVRQRDIETRRLSQGQKQRLQLARFALACQNSHRPIWLMDEPSAALDTQGSALLQTLLAEHLARGGAALVATHLPLTAGPSPIRPLRLGETAPLETSPVETTDTSLWTA
jgi:heme exporter protein A